MGMESFNDPQKNESMEQTEAVKNLQSASQTLLTLRESFKNWEPADLEYLNDAMQQINTLTHRLEDTPRPR
jgi:hypothetical protein